MKFMFNFLFLLSIITTTIHSSEKSLKDMLQEDSWEISFRSGSFSTRPDDLRVKNSIESRERYFSFMSINDAYDITECCLSPETPQGYKTCLAEILTGFNREETLRNTPTSISIRDLKNPKLFFALTSKKASNNQSPK